MKFLEEFLPLPLVLHALKGLDGFLVLEILVHALLAPSDLEQVAVQVDVPFVLEALAGEGLVEGNAVPVLLGIDEDSVAIEQESLGPVDVPQLRPVGWDGSAGRERGVGD